MSKAKGNFDASVIEQLRIEALGAMTIHFVTCTVTDQRRRRSHTKGGGPLWPPYAKRKIEG